MLANVVFSGALVRAGQTTPELLTFFREQMGLTDNRIATIARGTAVAKVLPSKTPAEIFVFSAVFVNATPEEYVKLAFDVGRLRRLPSYPGVGRFSDPPMLSDLKGFTLEPEDIRNLKIRRPGKGGVQLPAEAMQELQKALDWSGPNVATQVNDRVWRMAPEVLRRYWEDGNSVRGTDRDTSI
ncbi:MAG: hypothetical protein NT090_15510 [Acidobacteria bacterium]|nr:hypothetical protein [Acidobacteriota bacterium]